MSDIETEKFRQIGIDLINEYRKQREIRLLDWMVIDTPEESAFIRSIQLHEKTKNELQSVKQEFADFKQKVSDAVEMQAKTVWDIHCQCGTRHPIGFTTLEQFIIPAPKPDPLVAALAQLDFLPWKKLSGHADDFRAALDALGFEIREKNDGEP